MFRMVRVLLAAAAASWGCIAAGQSIGMPAATSSTLTPAQSAWVGAEIRRADDLFVRRVVAITNMPPDTVRQAIPAKGRITDPAARTVSAIEKFGGKPLSDEQKTAIRSAEEDRRQMIASAREKAASK